MTDELSRGRSIFRRGAVIVLLATIIPVLSGGDLAVTVLLHALWAGWVFTVGELLGRRVLTVVRASLLSTAGGLLFLPAIIFVSGQTGSLFYLLLVCLPLIIASMAPTDQPSVILSGSGGLGWILALELSEGHGAARIVSWALFAVLCASIAVWATVLHRRSEAERLVAVDRLGEQQRKEARTERLALLGQLAASIAHEVNNPLAFVTANVSYLGGLLKEAPPPSPDDRLEGLEDTTQGLERIGNTIRMLQIFVQPNGGPVTGNVSEAVGESMALAAGRLRKLVVPTTTVPEELPPVALGHRRLVQILVNLLLNAADAVEGVPSPSITISRATGWVRLVVENSGRSAPQGARLTPSDFRIGPARAGLGLALCREHVEEVGGSLSVDPRPEGGSRVTVALPASSAAT